VVEEVGVLRVWVFSDFAIGDGMLEYDFKDRAEEGFKAS
jgi:hypothetical protein